jgi:hypothetical protein
MPLEVNEIGIVMRVREGGEGSERIEAARIESPERREQRREELVDECVRRVLQALRMERER